ncbi:MAG: aminopeptidase [Anaerolineae bacterium]
MIDERLSRLAKLLVDYSAEIKPNERVVINSEPAAAPLILAVYERALEVGAFPHISLTLPGQDEAFFRAAAKAQLADISPVQALFYEEYDVLLSIRASTNTRELNGVDPERQAMRRKALHPLRQRFMDRSATGELKWTATLFPTEAYAQEADMSLRDYEDFVLQACHCDQADPVAAWQAVHEEQQAAVDWLAGRDQVVISGPNAALTLSIRDRVFINSDGHHNMPSGEIFTGPVEDSVEGWVRFTYPALVEGREVAGIELVFEEGRVVKASAQKNEPYLLRMLEVDEGARYLGEFAIGTNYGIQQFTKNILFDEKIGGSFHVALGAGYPETGSKNRSAIHWDMICDMREGGEIRVDGDLLYENGAFVI